MDIDKTELATQISTFSERFQIHTLKKKTERKRKREKERDQSNKFDQAFHTISKGFCQTLLSFSIMCLLVSYKKFMENINRFRQIILFEHLIL